MKVKPYMPLTLATLTLAIAFGSPTALAQSDNFDSGTLDPAWKRSNFNPALVQLSFPTVGSGKGLRIQANPVPDPALNAVELLYRDNEYADFYMAVDLVDWGDVSKNQACVLIARATVGAHPGEAAGVIANYDTSQYGDTATSRRQGQFQINLVAPGFSTTTLAVAELTLAPGRPYRMVFTGVGSLYTARIYDHHDLTKPVVTLKADDGGQYTSGKCGFLSFYRVVPGSTDVTIDNYVAAAADPHAPAAPALPHPIPGTPTVDTRTPTNRFTNFLDPSSGISFTAKTFTTDVIDASETKLRLNTQDVSGQLVLSADGASITGSLPGSALTTNKLYAAEIVVQDASGSKRSTNTFWFDTFSDGYLRSAAVKVIEAEHFNYDGGQFIADPIPLSGYTIDGAPVGEGGYLELGGVEGIDFHDALTSAEAQWLGEYRSQTPVGLTAGIYPEIRDLDEPDTVTSIRRSDNVRSQYAAVNMLEMVVHRTQQGEWLNYTRNFTPGTYTPYLRVASFGASAVELHKVTSDPTAAEQTTTKLGTFNIPNLIQRYNYTYVPLAGDLGNLVSVDLTGTNTLRLVMAGTAGQDDRKLAINYLMFVPAATGAITVYSSATVDGTFTADATATVTGNTVTIPIGAGNRFYRLSGNVTLSKPTISGNTMTFTFQ